MASRNRQRGGPVSGEATREEQEMWNGLVKDIKGAKELKDKQRTNGLKIRDLEEKIGGMQKEGKGKRASILCYFSLHLPCKFTSLDLLC